MQILYLFLIVISSRSTKSNEPDPCSATVYEELKDIPKRNPTFNMNYAPICDYHLTEGSWYRAGFSIMATSPPSLAKCGTLYPYWLKGDHPAEGMVTDAEACQVGFRNNCARKAKIKIKNCSTFMVYRLEPVKFCASAYCFELSKECVSEVPSDLLVSYHNVSWKEDIDGVFTSYIPSVNLKCSFTPLPDTSLYYEISWYVDNIEVVKQTLNYDTLENALLSSKHIKNKQKKSGSMVYCLVGAKYKEKGVACNTEISPSFFAGIKVLETRLTMKRGGTAKIQLQFTIPYADESIKVGDFEPPASCLFVSLETVHGNLDSCRSKSAKQCDIQIEAYSYNDRAKYASDEWREIHEMTIFNTDDLDYKDVNQQVTIRLRTGQTHSEINQLFSNILLPDIQVYLDEPNSAWKGSHCGSYTDPHMFTFDGYWYECQEEGKYILYRNSKFNQEVQVEHHRCHPSYSYPRCTCAVAARSGRDIFTVNVCMGKTYINFPLCEDKAFKVIRKNDKYYQVLFPTGTLVEMLIVGWPDKTSFQINVKIFPSPSDVGQTRGLCGILDGKQENDLTRRNNVDVDNPKNFHYSKHPRDFSMSWEVNDDEDLFLDINNVPEKFTSISETFTRACTCKVLQGDVTECGVINKASQIECHYGTFRDCKYQIGKTFDCVLHPAGAKRKKRDLLHLKSMEKIVDISTKETRHLERGKRQVYDVRTENEAKDVCFKAFQESEAFTTCQQYIPDLSTNAVDNCISDVMMTGDNNITKIHIEAALEQCSNLVLFNSTFQEEQPEVTHIIETLCPNNCSGNGECHEGNCTCDENFAGSDCSFDLLGPPNIKHISDFGFCDKSYEECDEITLYGELFLEQMNTECHMTRRTIAIDNTILSQTIRSSLAPRTLFEGYCTLSYSTETHWLTEFTFNVSNDGIRFTNNFNVYTYQSDCQELRNDSGIVSFSLKSGYCFINGRCYIDGGTNRDNQCDMCNVTKDRYSWTFNPGHCLINGTCYGNGTIMERNPCSACLSSLDRWNWSNNPGYCYIDGICYFDGQSKKHNECYKCNYTLNRTAWIFNEGHCLIDGQCFKAGESHLLRRCMLCDPFRNRNNWTMSTEYCFVNGSCMQDGESLKGNPCLMCNISNSKYSFSPNPDYCNIDGLCVANGQMQEDKSCLYCNTTIKRGNWSLSPGFCFVNDSCMKDGESFKRNQCLMCKTSYSRFSLFPNPGFCNIDGLCLPDGQKHEVKPCLFCNTSLTRGNWSIISGYCLIGDQCYQSSQSHWTQTCKLCNPLHNNRKWTLRNGYCFINGSCMQNDEIDKSDKCFMCNTSASLDSLSQNHAYCNIDGQCVPNGQERDAKSCFYCNTATNRESWSLRKGHCYIQETCFQDMDVNSTFPCHICDSSKDVVAFSFNQAYCHFGDLCVADGQNNDVKSCLYCNISLTRKSWSYRQDYCMIEGSCIKHGSSQRNKYCRVCDAHANNSVWQIKEGHCYIQEICFKNSEVNQTFPCQICNSSKETYQFSSNPAYCNIGGLCVPDGQKNDTMSCFYCNATSNRENWSFNRDYCIINGSCIKHGSAERNKECRICDVTSNHRVWKIRNGSCFIKGKCFKDSEVNSTFPCHMCNSSNDVYDFSSNLAHCNIDGLCVPNGQKNDIKPCLYCNTSLTRGNWSFNQEYCRINGSCIKHGSTEQNKTCRVCDVYKNHAAWQIKKGHCYIQESCFKDSDLNLTFPCQTCNSSNNVHGFSSNRAYCNIGELCVPDGQKHKAKPCLYCNTSLTRGNWSFNQEYCMINGNCVKHGSRERNRECRICDVRTNHSVWQIQKGHCFVYEKCFKDSEVNSTFPCQICNSTKYVFHFSSNPDYCMINGQCVQNGKTEHNKDCKVCNAYTDNTDWQLKSGYCYIANHCFKDFEINSTFPCEICNSSNDVYKFSTNPAYCHIGDLCVADGQKSYFKSCLYCNTSQNRGNWSLTQVCLSLETAKVTRGSPFTNPTFIATVSIIVIIFLISITIVAVYRFYMKWRENWSTGNMGTDDGNVGLTIYKKINTED